MDDSLKMVCIVDNDLSMRRALGRLIRSFGYEVELYGSGRECVDGHSVDQSDCLILDVSMPGLNGFEVFTLLRASGRNIPTIFISGHDDEVIREKALVVGGVAFLDKPCDEKSLRGAIDRAIAGA